jgi:hypothetical protein
MDEVQITTLVVVALDLAITTVGLGLVVMLLFCIVNPATVRNRLPYRNPQHRQLQKIPSSDTDVSLKDGLPECSSRPTVRKNGGHPYKNTLNAGQPLVNQGLMPEKRDGCQHRSQNSGDTLTDSTDRKGSDGDQMSERERRTMYSSLSRIKLGNEPSGETQVSGEPMGESSLEGTEPK